MHQIKLCERLRIDTGLFRRGSHGPSSSIVALRLSTAELRKFPVEQFMRSHPSCRFDLWKIFRWDRFPLEPLGNSSLTDSNCDGQFLLGTRDSDGPLKCTHESTLAALILAVNSGADGEAFAPRISVAHMGTDKNKGAKPTAADKEAGKRLRKIWEDSKPKLTQDEIAAQFGEGVTQGNISQYMTGRIPLGAAAVLKFAAIFGCSPLAIREDLPELHAAMPPSNDPLARELWLLWPRLDLPTRKYLLETARHKLQSEHDGVSPFEKTGARQVQHKRTTS